MKTPQQYASEAETLVKTKPNKTKNFIPKKSSAIFKLTPEEAQHLENLMVWQSQSAKSVIKLGGAL